MVPFDLWCRTRVVFGPGTLNQLGALASELGARRAVVVSDPGIIEAGHTSRGVASLEAAGITTYVFEGVRENPSTDDVDRGASFCRRYDPEIIIGLGGGSSMDCAKGMNFIHTNGGTMRDYWGVGKALKAMLPMIAIPTTAGTGSETQSFALISDAQTHVKMACGDKKASFRVAILDPELTLTQPPRVTALTGIDAIAHALETYVTTKRNPASIAFSREAWRLLATNFPKVLANPQDLESRGGMLLGACFAGIAIENSMLGATHAMANPVTAHYGVPHGLAVGVLLPHVIRFNGTVCGEWYEELVAAVMDVPEFTTGAGLHGSERIARWIHALLDRAGLPTTLIACGVKKELLSKLAEDASTQWTGTFNPRPLSVFDLTQLYEKAYSSNYPEEPTAVDRI